MLTQKQKKIQFKRRLAVVKTFLPYNYGLMYKVMFGDENIQRVYDVFNKDYVDNQILFRLIQVAKLLRKTRKHKPLEVA